MFSRRATAYLTAVNRNYVCIPHGLLELPLFRIERTVCGDKEKRISSIQTICKYLARLYLINNLHVSQSANRDQKKLILIPFDHDRTRSTCRQIAYIVWYTRNAPFGKCKSMMWAATAIHR